MSSLRGYLEDVLHLRDPADDVIVPRLELVPGVGVPGRRRRARHLLQDAAARVERGAAGVVVVAVAAGAVVARPEGGVLHAVEVGVVFNTEI